jgi:ribosome biogenesis GTPase
LIVANKTDLVEMQAAHEIFGLYTTLGYEVIYASAKTGLGVTDLREALRGKISALAGPSGVGKSSLLNAVQPELGLHVREVSEVTSKGRHTTQVRELFPLDVGGYVADTPGIRSLALWDTEPEELDAYFVELRDLVARRSSKARSLQNVILLTCDCGLVMIPNRMRKISPQDQWIN